MDEDVDARQRAEMRRQIADAKRSGDPQIAVQGRMVEILYEAIEASVRNELESGTSPRLIVQALSATVGKITSSVAISLARPGVHETAAQRCGEMMQEAAEGAFDMWVKYQQSQKPETLQ